MKRKRYVKLCSLVICFVLLCNVMSYSVSAKYYSDTYVGMLDREFFDAMNYVTDNGWMTGIDIAHFRPYVGITRGMFVTVLYRYSGDTGQYTSNFTDVPSSLYYYNPISWANYHNIVNGMTETTFEPETVITKEQMAVILYRYAKNIEEKTYAPISFDSISEHPDYGSVSLYAREAVRWAKTYHVFPLADSNSYISPLAEMNRAYTALYITNYSREVTGFIDRDRFSFSHQGGVTFSSNCALSNNAKVYLLDSIDNYYGEARSEIAARDRETMLEMISSPFRGSCFGITICTYFDKLGKIDFNKNMGSGAISMSSVGIPKDNTTTVESAINYYQFLHSISDFQNKYITYSNDTSNLSNAFALFCDYVDRNGVTPFAYFYINDNNEYGGHAILVTEVKHNVDRSIYTIKAVDPNSTSLSTKKLFIIDGSLVLSNSGNINDDKNKELVRITYYPTSACNFFDYFDLDGSHNQLNVLEQESSSNSPISCTGSINDLSSLEPSYTSDTALLRVPYVPFEIRNTSGDVLYCDGFSLSGSMGILHYSVIPNGPDHPADLLITVEKSNSYICTPLSSADTYFSVSSPDGFASISGTGITSASVDFIENSLYVNGSDIQYSAWIKTSTQNYEYFFIRGNNCVPFSVSAEPAGITTVGLSGLQECGFASADELTATTTFVAFSERTVLDCPETNELS